MIYLYISPSCQSCRKAVKWFNDEKIEYELINILTEKLTREDIFRMLKNSYNGFDDIISKRSKPYMESNLNFDEMKTSDLVQFIIDNPTILKRPIMVSKEILVVGYNSDEIRSFIPRERRRYDYHGKECSIDPSKCGFIESTNKVLDDVKEKV